MKYLVRKTNSISNKVELFISSSTLAEKFNRKKIHVEAKIKAIMILGEYTNIKTDKYNKTVIVESNNIFCNKELTKFILDDWKSKSNSSLITEILSEFNNVDNNSSIITNEYKAEDIPDIIIDDNIDTDNDKINITIHDRKGKPTINASELFISLGLGNLYDFENWSRENIIHNSLYVDGLDYEEFEAYNPDNNPHFYTDYSIDLYVASELISKSKSKNSLKVRTYLLSHAEQPVQNKSEDYSEFVNNLRLNIYYIERYLPSVLNWKTAELIMPKLLDKCMEEINSGNIKVEVFSAVIRTSLKIVDKEKDYAKKELLNRHINEWMIKRAQIYAGIISSVKTENARLKEKLSYA